MAALLRFPNRASAPVPKTAAANLLPVRQRTQFTCMASSMSMCLGALGLQDCSEDTVNRVMGAAPMRGAAWEQALATAQHYGVRATLTVPATLSQVKEWTDAGKPVMIGWNPEGREWSHASVIFDVQPCPTHGFMVHVADPNCPDPEQVVRVVSKSEFYAKWYEKFPNYLVRRPALMLEREVTPEGRQVMASMKPTTKRAASVLVDEPLTVPVSEVPMSKQAKSPIPVVQKKNPNVMRGEAPAGRNPVVQGLIERGSAGAGKHKNKGDYDRGHARNPKHRGEKGWGSEYMTLPVEEACGAEYMGDEACGAEYMQDHSAKFEEGVSVDPTKNMNEADAAEWERQNAIHRNEFTASAKGLLPSEAARLRDAGLAPKTAARDDSTFVPFPDFWLLPGAVKMKMKQKIEGMGLRFTPHRDGVELHAPLPATPADKRNLAYAVQVLEEGVRNRPAKTAAGLMTPHGRAPLIAPGDVTRWDSVEVESKDGGRTFAVVAYGRTAESKREVRSVLAFGYKDADQARKEADTYRVKLRVRTAAHRLDGVRGHQLLPATVARKLPAIYSQENVDDPIAQVKLFSPYSGAVWYLTEYDPSSKQGFGWADLGYGMGELGYIDITELEGLNRRGLPLVERDLYWKPMPLSRAKHSRTASKAARYDRGPLSPAEKAELFEGNPEFKDMNENPPETVLAIRRQMEKQATNSDWELSAPEDAGTMRGAKKWLGFARLYILSETEPGSPERAQLIAVAQKNFGYAAFLFRKNKGLVAFYADAKKQLGDILHTQMN